MIRVGVIGFGNWGVKVVENILFHPEIQLISIAEKCSIKREKISTLYPHLKIYSEGETLIVDKEVDAVFVVTNATSHYYLVKCSLLAKKHVFVEKPFTTSSVEASELIQLAKINQLVIVVDHILLYNNSLIKFQTLINQHILGNTIHYLSRRANNTICLKDVDVLWDLAYHDLSMLLSLFAEKPIHLNVLGETNSNDGLMHTANLELNYPSGFTATIYCSWNAKQKERSVQIIGDNNELFFNEQTGECYTIDQANKRINIENSNQSENPLYNVIDSFVNKISTKDLDDRYLNLSLSIITILEAAHASFALNGANVEIVWNEMH